MRSFSIKITILTNERLSNNQERDEWKQTFDEHSWQDRTSKRISRKAQSKERIESESKHQKIL